MTHVYFRCTVQLNGRVVFVGSLQACEDYVLANGLTGKARVV